MSQLDLVRTTTDVGTLGIKAPEVDSGFYEPYDPGLSDVWSCGVVMATIMAGRAPFVAADQADAAFRHWERLCKKRNRSRNKTTGKKKEEKTRRGAGAGAAAAAAAAAEDEAGSSPEEHEVRITK